MQIRATFNPKPLIEYRGYTPQRIIADKIGVTKGMYSMYERGRMPSLAKLIQIMELLNVDFHDLVKIERIAASTPAQANASEMDLAA